jgi:hypothetical protein
MKNLTNTFVAALRKHAGLKRSRQWLLSAAADAHLSAAEHAARVISKVCKHCDGWFNPLQAASCLRFTVHLQHSSCGPAVAHTSQQVLQHSNSKA